MAKARRNSSKIATPAADTGHDSSKAIAAGVYYYVRECSGCGRVLVVSVGSGHGGGTGSGMLAAPAR